MRGACRLTGTRVLQLLEPWHPPACVVGVRATDSSTSPFPLGALCRKLLTQPPEAAVAAASRIRAEPRRGAAARCRSEPACAASHGCARAGAQRHPRGTKAGGDRAHAGPGPPAGLALPQPAGSPKLLCPGAAQHGRVPWGSHRDHGGVLALPETAAVGAWPRAALASPGNTMFLRRSSTSSDFNLVLLEALEPWMPNAII